MINQSKAPGLVSPGSRDGHTDQIGIDLSHRSYWAQPESATIDDLLGSGDVAHNTLHSTDHATNFIEGIATSKPEVKTLAVKHRAECVTRFQAMMAGSSTVTQGLFASVMPEESTAAVQGVRAIAME